VQQFGPVSVVFEPSFARDTVILSPCDTGGWEDSCGVQWWQEQCAKLTTAAACRHGSSCVWKGDRCAGVSVKHGVEFNCSAGSALGAPGHARHVLAASARLWTPWQHNDVDAAARAGYTPSSVDANMAMMVGRLVSPWNESNYPLARDHMDYYFEAAVVGTPRFPEGVHFVVGAFPDLFGTGVGLALRKWCVQHGWLLLWALGKNGASHGKFRGHSRIVDPTVADQIKRSDLPPEAIAASTAGFAAAWKAAAAAQPPLPTDKASELWAQAAKGVAPQLHVEPVMAGVCETPDSCVGVQVGSVACVCYQSRGSW